MARELFAAGFVSCWDELDPASQEQLVRSLEAALASPTIPPGELVSALLSETGSLNNTLPHYHVYRFATPRKHQTTSRIQGELILICVCH
jgi:hypothetical protein